MNLVQLKYLSAVATAGSFSKAAELCHVSQPTISNSIADLEGELGASLFRRTTRFVELTPFGMSIMGYVDNIFSLIVDIEHEAETTRNPQNDVLRIAFSPVVDSPKVMMSFEDHRQRNEGYNFIYKECGVEELESRLARGKLAISSIPINTAIIINSPWKTI